MTTSVARTERDRLLRVPLPSFIRPVLALAALVLVAGALPASAMARSAHAGYLATSYKPLVIVAITHQLLVIDQFVP